MTDPTSATVTPVPWYQHPENWVAIMTVLSLLLGGVGYTVTPDDQHTLVASGSAGVIAIVQFTGVLRRILASRA